MARGRLSAIVVVLCCVVLVGGAGSDQAKRSALIKSYFRQNIYYGTPWDQFGIDLSAYPQFWSLLKLDAAPAGALAGALGLEWPKCPSYDPNSIFIYSTKAYALFSYNWRYCILALGSGYGRCGYTNCGNRCCLLDSAGTVYWIRDMTVEQEPVISDSGTVAFIEYKKFPIDSQAKELGFESRHDDIAWADSIYRNKYLEISRQANARDSIFVSFIDADGKLRGRWGSPESKTKKLVDDASRRGVFAFMQSSENFIMLAEPKESMPGSSTPPLHYLRCIRPDGRMAWEQYLDSDATIGMCLIPGGKLIVGGSVGDGSSQSYTSALFLFNGDGRLLSRIERTSKQKMGDFLRITEPELFYFLADTVEALNLETGKLEESPSLRKLYSVLSSEDEWRKGTAERLIRSWLKLSVQDTIPPLKMQRK